MIFGEKIAEFNAAPLRTDARDGLLLLSLLGRTTAAVAVQDAWNRAREASPMFHWPAVVNRNPNATTFVLHDGEGAHAAQALYQIAERRPVVCDNSIRGSLTYVSFIEVAPWNSAAFSTRRYHRLGTFLVLVASSLEVRSGRSGALGLHAIDSAIGFYRSLGFEFIDCLNEYKELYLELDADRARELRNGKGVFP